MTKPLQIALISFSHGHQMDYGRLLAEHPQTQLVAVGDVPDITEEARKVAMDFAASRNVPYYADYHQMLEEQTIDAVSIAVSPSQNPAVVIACAKPISAIRLRRQRGLAAHGLSPDTTG